MTHRRLFGAAPWNFHRRELVEVLFEKFRIVSPPKVDICRNLFDKEVRSFLRETPYFVGAMQAHTWHLVHEQEIHLLLRHKGHEQDA